MCDTLPTCPYCHTEHESYYAEIGEGEVLECQKCGGKYKVTRCEGFVSEEVEQPENYEPDLCVKLYIACPNNINHRAVFNAMGDENDVVYYCEECDLIIPICLECEKEKGICECPKPEDDQDD